MKDAEIREYTSTDRHRFKQFYLTMETEKKQSRIIHALRQRKSAKRVWHAGIVGILGIHLSNFMQSSISIKSTSLMLLEMILWSAGVGLVWYRWISQEYEQRLASICERMATELSGIQTNDKSCAWVMEKDNQIIGTVALKYEGGKEGKIGYLTGLNPQIRLKLVQNAIRFGRTNKIDVISKWQNDLKWSESAFTITLRSLSNSLDRFPLRQLFSPTELDNDLTYIDKTYYASTLLPSVHSSSLYTDSSGMKASDEKQLSLSLQSLALNKTVNFVKSISHLDLRNIGLFTLPNQVSLLTRLTLLDLSHNKLEKLPSSMDQLKNLRHLNLSHNELYQIPSSIYFLEKLNHLDVSFNPFKQIPANIACLINLSFLDLSNTNIYSIPVELLRLSMTMIRVDGCSHIIDRSIEFNHNLTHNPVSLFETCARSIIRPILYNLTMKKKRKKQELRPTHIDLKHVPNHIRSYLSQPKACSSCGGPYFQSYVVRYRIVQRQDELWIPVEYRMCSAHWNTESDRILSLFSKKPSSYLPASSEHCSFELISPT
ncbi:hypothetical protein EDC96DRAFT_562657 [Choanephora cucurbitarum]|nr:hypothetical protein EDC96DRAFT_562657 [Choanephora cucurbitarum]